LTPWDGDDLSLYEKDQDFVDIFDPEIVNAETFVNWDGEVVENKKPWYDEKVFKLLGVDINVRKIVLGAGAKPGIVIASITLCCVVSWWNMKKIAELL
jgi:hypothetical protein